MNGYLFSYGTLLPEHAPQEIADVVAKLEPLGAGSIPGFLYDFGEYPGAIFDPSSNRRVRGVVFRLPQDSDVLRRLDDYEGFRPNARRQSLFIRKLHPVKLADGRMLRCWVYTYNGKPGVTHVVTSGRYGKKRAARRS